MIDADPRAAWMFQRATGLGKYRKDVPVDALAAAAITAVRHEDCGPCTQLGVSMAERAGVDPKVLRAVLTETPAMMPPDVALAWRFTRATLDHDPSADQYRDEIIKRWGPRAVVSLAFAIVTARMYPTVKYAMGHGKACTRIVVDGAPIAFDKALVSGATGMTTDPSASSSRTGGVCSDWRIACSVRWPRPRTPCRKRICAGTTPIARSVEEPQGVSDDDDDQDLSRRAEVGAHAA